MCIAGLVACPEYALVATDTRTTWFDADGRAAHHSDAGGKLRRMPGGWATCTGFGAVALMGLDRLERTSADLESVRRAILAARDEAQPEPGDSADYFVAGVQEGRTWGAAFNMDGDPTGRLPVPCKNYFALQMPYGAPLSNADTLTRQINGRVRAAGSLLERLRRIAEGFVEVHAFGTPTMSEMIEVGILTADGAAHLPPTAVRQVAGSSDAELEVLLIPETERTQTDGT